MKRKTFFKLSALLLVIVMMLPVLAACTPEKPSFVPNDVEFTLDDYIVIAERGLTNFSLGYSVDAKTVMKAEAKLLVEYITEVTEATLAIVEDGSRGSYHEIYVGVVGEMGRPEVEEIIAPYALGLDDYLIKVCDGIVIVAAGTKEAGVSAISYLQKRLLYVDEENGMIAIPKDLEYVYRYDNAVDKKGLEKVQVNKRGQYELTFTLNPGSGVDVPVRLTYAGLGGWRIQTKHNMAEPFDDIGAAQRIAVGLGELPYIETEALTYWEDDASLIAIAPDGTYVVLNKQTFSLKFCTADGELSRMITGLNHSITGKTNKLTLFVNFSLDQNEMIFGSGERFDSLNQRGKTLALQSGEVSDDVSNSYVAVPLFSSSNGSGIFINSDAYMDVDIGESDHYEMGVTLEAGNIDCYVFVTDQIADVLSAYTTISGAAQMPAEWVSGLLVCRYEEGIDTLEAVKRMIAKMQVYGLPWTGIVIDGWNVYDFEKHDELATVCDMVHAMGKRVICNLDVGFYPGAEAFPEELVGETELDSFYLTWEFTYYYTEFSNGKYSTSTVRKNTTANIPVVEAAGAMLEVPLFITAPNVDSKNPLLSNPFATALEGGNRENDNDNYVYDTKTYIDITNTAAVEWFFGTYWNYLVDEIGVDGVKVDGGNLLPDTHGTFKFANSNMQTGGARHWYSTLYTAFLNKVLEKKLDGGVAFARGGGIGSQRNAIILGGEQSRNVNRLERQVKGLISAGMSGLPFVTYDAGGSIYKNGNVLGIEQEANIFLRGAQFAAFTIAMQTADGEVRGAFDFAEEDEAYAYVTELYGLYAKLHDAMNPYIQEYAKVATETGLPLARHLILMYQDDANVYDITDEYMFGDAFLVAPELYGEGQRDVYLPAGEWINVFTGETVQGGETVTVNATMAQIPVFYNVNTTSATAAEVYADMQVIIDQINAVELP